MADDDDFAFDFEGNLQKEAETYQGASAGPGGPVPHVAPGTQLGQSLTNFKKNYRQTVCTYWLKGLCMKGDSCGFLHMFDSERMPTCRAMVKHGVCREPDCPYKHTTEDIKECNMYRLGFCVYGPTCRYKHTRLPGPPPDPSTLEAARPRAVRNVNAVVNSVNIGITAPRMERVRMLKAIEAGGGAGSAAAAAAQAAVQARAQRRGQQLQLPGPPVMPTAPQ